AEPERSREARTRTARAEQPDRRQRYVGGRRAYAVEWVVRRKVAAGKRLQLEQLLRKALRVERTERGRHCRIGPRRAADAQVDAAGVQRLERVERLGDAQRSVIRQHDAARTHADALRVRGSVRDEHLR